jgi:hypothetical protein
LQGPPLNPPPPPLLATKMFILDGNCID